MKELQNRPITIWKRKQSLGLRFLIYSMIDVPVKVSGITSLTDARYCAGMGVQYLGLQFDSSLHAPLSLTEFRAIQEWIEGIEWVGEYFGNSISEIKELASGYGITLWEVRQAELIVQLAEVGLIPCYYGDQVPDLKMISDCRYQIIPFDSDKLIASQIQSMPTKIIDGITDEVSLKLALQKHPDCGFQFHSGEEERPGWMDLSDLQEVLEFLDEVEKS